MPRRAHRDAGPVTRIDKDTTAAEVAESLGHLSASAKAAYDRRNYILYDICHRHIDEKLEVWQVLSALENARAPHIQP